MPREKVVVVGFGWVGQANALALSRMGYAVAYFDLGEPAHHYLAYASEYVKVRRLSSVRELDSQETVYIVCVGDKVNEEGMQNIDTIRAALKSLEGVAGSVVLRSTVLPDLLEDLSFDFYMPEFLHEKHAVEECSSPHFFVLGKRSDKKEPGFFAAWRRMTPLQFEGTPREASFVKYLSNLWNATRIAFVNEFGDAIATPDSPQHIDSISRIINFVLREEEYTRYGRAFGGHCLPKDTRAFAAYHAEHNKHVEFLRGMYASNHAHAQLEKNYPALPEWFSQWQTPHLSGFVAWREFWHSVLKNLRNPRDLIDRYLLGMS